MPVSNVAHTHDTRLTPAPRLVDLARARAAARQHLSAAVVGAVFDANAHHSTADKTISKSDALRQLGACVDATSIDTTDITADAGVRIALCAADQTGPRCRVRRRRSTACLMTWRATRSISAGSGWRALPGWH
jgi:hypothetical protein